MIDLRTPDQIYGQLFTDVQMSGIFADSKTFVDLEPVLPPQEIIKQYNQAKASDDFDLRHFVDQHFTTEARPEVSADLANGTIDHHIDHLWGVLRRPADTAVPEGSSKLPLPYDYVVPGGRFNEIYYWDSYFTMVGLVDSHLTDLAVSMFENFTHLIDTYGHIPNGNRTYFISRSQPPFYSLMYRLLAPHLDPSRAATYYRALQKEYQFWMAGTPELTASSPVHRRVVSVGEHVVNRYFDDHAAPRQESYREDVEDAKQVANKSKFYRHIRAACESGWDFSSRWLRQADDLTTIQTCDLVPVDLNCLLWHAEDTLADLSTSDKETAHYRAAASRRALAIHDLCWNADLQYYTDYHFTRKQATGHLTAATVYPLFFGLASQEQATAVAQAMDHVLIKDGGLMTTLQYSGQQWDAPNGWAPLQYMAVYGLDKYGLTEVARRIAKGWCYSCETKYATDHKLIEKYNVTDPLTTARGGEYPAQDGFGWTNAMYLHLKHYLVRS